MIGRSFKACLWAGFLAAFVKFSIVALASGPTSPTTTLTLAWDPSTDPTVAGYRLYQGTASLAYTKVVDIGNSTTALVSDLVGGATYFFAVTAYDGAGVESPFSGEISYTVPASAPLPSRLRARLSIVPSASSPVLLTGSGTAGYIYDVYATKDFSAWFIIGSVIVDSSGSFQFTDENSLTIPARFYRLIQATPQPPAP